MWWEVWWEVCLEDAQSPVSGPKTGLENAPGGLKSALPALENAPWGLENARPGLENATREPLRLAGALGGSDRQGQGEALPGMPAGIFGKAPGLEVLVDSALELPADAVGGQGREVVPTMAGRE